MTLHHDDLSVPFRDRIEAGRALARRLHDFARRADAMVLALPRGGIPVGAEIATALELPLLAFVVRKMGVPGHAELAMGAVSSGGKTLINHAIADSLRVPGSEVRLAIARELHELHRRERLYSRGRPMPDLKDKLVILTDDGVATGSSMFLAAQAVRAQGAAYVVVAVPVGPVETIAQLHKFADEVICLAEPELFTAVGQWYEDFHQVTDQEACLILDHLFERTCEPQPA